MSDAPVWLATAGVLILIVTLPVAAWVVTRAYFKGRFDDDASYINRLERIVGEQDAIILAATRQGFIVDTREQGRHEGGAR